MDSDERLRASVQDLRNRIATTPDHQVLVFKEWYAEQLKSDKAEDIHFALALDEIINAVGSAKKKKEQLVLLVHGIRTQAEWQGMVRDSLTRVGTVVEPIKYEYFDAFRFWFPFFTRKLPLKQVLWKVRHAIGRHEGREVVIIAHSFGTYAILNILVDQPDIRCTRLLLCGSVVDRAFRWDKLANLPEVLNDCGSRDIWPVLAQSLSWGYGASGTFGFGTPGVRDRAHDCRHGDYFNKEFVERYWLPWLHHGIYVPSEFESTQPASPWWRSVLTILPLRWMAVAVVLAAIYWIASKFGLADYTGTM
jgi:pimeloyl-ACP methyl ester carboxylesterase